MATNSTSPPQCKLIITVTDTTNDTILTLLYSLIGIFITVSNLTLIIALPKIKATFKRFDRLFILLSAVDICVGILLMPLNIYLIHKNAPGVTCVEVGIKTLINTFTSVQSGLITCLITNDRYLLITNRKLHEEYMTTKCMTGIVLVMFAMAVSWAVVAVHVSMVAKGVGKALFFLTFSSYALIILLEIIVVNIRLRTHLRAVASKCNNAEARYKGHVNRTIAEARYKGHVNRTILIISACLVIAYSPTIIGFMIGSVMTLLQKSEETPSSSAVTFLTWIILPTNLNSGLNSAIFMWRNTAFRRYLKAICGRNHDVTTIYVTHKEHQSGKINIAIE